MTDIFFKNMHEFPPKFTCDSGHARLTGYNLHALKEIIADGSYQVSSGQIAEKIVSTQLFLFTSCC